MMALKRRKPVNLLSITLVELAVSVLVDVISLSPFVQKLIIVLAQLRHMLLAEWSLESAVENQQHVFLAAQISQGENLA
jgi:hypothetical protein